MSRATSLRALLLCVLAAVAPCAAWSAEKPEQERRRREGALNIGVTVLPESMDPRVNWHNVHFLLHQLFTRGLVRLDDAGFLQPDLARSWRISPDGRVYEFRLSTGITFFDGVPVRCEDIRYSFSRHYWPDSPSVIGAYLKDVLLGAAKLPSGASLSSIECPHPDAMIVRLRQPYPPFLEIISMPGFGVIKKGSGESGVAIGAGSMRVEKLADGEIRFRRVSGAAAGGDIRVRRYESDEAMARALEAGAADISLGFSFERMDRDIPEGYKRVRSNTPGMLHLYLNDRFPPFKDVRVRREVRDMLQSAVARVGDPGYFLESQRTFLPRGFMPPVYYRREERVRTPADLRASSAALGGGRMRVILRTEYLSALALEAIKRAFAESGFDADIEVKSISRAVEDLRSGDYDAIMGGYFSVSSDADGFLGPLFSSDPLRHGRFPSERLERTIKKARYLPDPRIRRDKYAEALRDFEEEAYVVPLFRLYFPIVAHEDLLLPDTNFRYDVNLSKVVWRSK